MTITEQHEMTRLFLAGALTESVALFHQHGILAEIERTAEWSERYSAAGRIRQFGVGDPEALFRLHRQTAGYCDWHVDESAEGLSVTASSCKLHAIASTRGTASPCRLCCIIPLRALCGALAGPYLLRVQSTLWDAHHCRFILTPQTQGTSL